MKHDLKDRNYLHEQFDMLFLPQEVFIQRAPLWDEVQDLPLPVEGLLSFLLTPAALSAVSEHVLRAKTSSGVENNLPMFTRPDLSANLNINIYNIYIF